MSLQRAIVVPEGISEPIRTGLAAATLQRAVRDNLLYLQARSPQVASAHDWYMALAYSVRDRLLARWESTVQAYASQTVKVACYLSAEFLIGPQLGSNLLNLGIEASARRSCASAAAASVAAIVDPPTPVSPMPALVTMPPEISVPPE